MNDILKKIQAIGIVPVVKIDDVEKAVPLAKALCQGGIPCAEVTFRTDAAEEAIKRMAEAYPDMLLGAGTVLTTEQVDKAIEAGAKFIVSPGLNEKIVKYCIDRSIPVTPGCATPSDVEKAIELGLSVVKFFPAEAAGGLNMIKSMAAPYGNMMFMPTGGIGPKNLNEYLAFPKILACGGSWMVKADLIAEDRFDEIEALTKEAVEKMLGFEVVHIGINGESEENASALADTFSGIFGFQKKVGNSSVFAGNAIEITKKPYMGKNGHIAVGTNHLDRAVNYLMVTGCEVDMETAKYNTKGNMTAVYLKGDFGGFAVHLVQK